MPGHDGRFWIGEVCSAGEVESTVGVYQAMRRVREEDVCKAASGLGERGRVQGVAKVVRCRREWCANGCGWEVEFLVRPSPPQYPASDDHQPSRKTVTFGGVVLLCKHVWLWALPGGAGHDAGGTESRSSFPASGFGCSSLLSGCLFCRLLPVATVPAFVMPSRLTGRKLGTTKCGHCFVRRRVPVGDTRLTS